VNGREERLARNEAMFREINERLESRIQNFTDGEAELAILCECADPDCTDRIRITPDAYEAVRRDGRRFIIRPGHERLEIEEVVERNDDYEVIRKRGVAGQVAEQLSDEP
jgi:hypothetical protein